MRTLRRSLIYLQQILALLNSRNKLLKERKPVNFKKNLNVNNNNSKRKTLTKAL
jgi:hypothetical protein